MNSFIFDTFSTSFGPFSIAFNNAGAVVATAFGNEPELRRRLGSGPVTKADSSLVAVAKNQVVAYLDGQRRDFDLPLAPHGTPFQQKVWTALRRIPFGETRSYGEVAAQLGQPNASRAVGRANATNPICVITPCHRVIGADGSLTGFAFGEDIKRRLLVLEGALAPALV